MNRRQMIMLPGVAMVASQVTARAAQAPGTGTQRASRRVTRKLVLKYDRPKAICKVPKSEPKLAKYLRSLTALLDLNAAQQQQAAAIFSAAVTAQAGIRSDLKLSRQALANAVVSNDGAGMTQGSAAVGTLTGQLTAAGANANAAFYQILTADQQSKLTQIKI